MDTNMVVLVCVLGMLAFGAFWLWLASRSAR
jgi:hypothetical protein